MTDYVSKLLKGAGIIFLVSILSSAFGYFIRIILARKLTIEEFGLFFAVYSVVLMIGWIKGFGTGSAIQKFVPEFQIKNEKDKIKSALVFVFVFSLLSSIFFLLLFYFFPERLINGYFKSNLAKSLLLLLFLFVSVDDLSKIMSGYFISRHFPLLFSLRELTVRVSVFILLLAMAEINVFGAALIYVTAASLGLLINSGFFFKLFHFFRYKTSITKEFIKKIFKFSLPLTIKDFFDVFMSYTDNLVLVYFRPLVEVAIYNVILPTADLLLMFGRPFGRIMFPLTSELWALNNKEKISFLVGKIHKYLLLLLIPAIVVVFVFAKFILKLLFGADYAIGFGGLQILIIGFLFSTLNIVSYSVLLGIGRPKEATKVTILVNVINLALNLLLIPLFGRFGLGYIGAIISTVFCSFLLFLFFWHYLKRFIGYSFPIKDWFLVCMAGLFLLALGLIVARNIANIYAQIIIFGLIILVFYPPFLILSGLVSKKEIRQLINQLLKKDTMLKQNL